MTPFGETDQETTRAKRVLGLVPVLAILTALIGIAMLIAWLTMNSVEQRQWPHLFLMKANTALALFLLAVALFALWAKGQSSSTASAVCACTVIAFSLAVLAQYFVPIDLGIDQWIVTDHATDRIPGRTSIGTAISLLMIGTAYLFHTSARGSLISQGILLAALVMPIATIGGYLYRAPDLSPFYRSSVMSAHSAICTLLLCAGGLFVRPNTGLMRLLLSESSAGIVARRLLPAAMLLPAAVGAAILYAERVGFFSNALGFATLVASCALFFGAAVWIVAAMMWRTEYAKALAESTRDAAELRLREGEQRLRIALEAGRLGTWEFLVDSGQLITSPQCKAIYGLEADAQFDYSDFLNSILPADRERVRDSAVKAPRELSDYKEQYAVGWPDGTSHWVLASGRPLLDEAGTASRMVGVSLDITDSVRAAEELKLADKRKDEFLATLAHELRNPLAPIRQAVKIANSEQVSSAQRSWGLSVIDRQAAHMAVLLDDLLDTSRVTRGQLHLHKESVDIHAVLDAAIETAQPSISAKGQQIRLQRPQEPMPLYADPVRLAQMLSNLLINAAKYSSVGGEIFLTVEVDEDLLRFRVKDHGIGIASDMLARIFEMFAQVDDDRKRSGEGLGIGLALVKGLAELHGGTVVASSEGLGRGSEFVISLPRGCEASSPTSTTKPLPPVTPPSRRILIADDNQDATESLKLLLEMEGHEVLTAADGEIALDQANRMLPEVMLLDLGMPKLNGYELATRVREQPWGKNITLVAVTGWGQAEDRRRSAEAGFDQHLTKPLEFEVLRALLSERR